VLNLPNEPETGCNEFITFCFAPFSFRFEFNPQSHGNCVPLPVPVAATLPFVVYTTGQNICRLLATANNRTERINRPKHTQNRRGTVGHQADRKQAVMLSPLKASIEEKAGICLTHSGI
jgi:hypothetical protein